MTIQEPSEQARTVAIVGLGSIGQAVGRALAQVRTNYRLVGHDRDADRVKAAAQAGAIDQGKWNLVEMVAQADLVVLAEPLHDLLETLETIAPHVAPGALVTDTASAKQPVLRVAERVLPPGVSFIGGHPVLRRATTPQASPLAGATYCLVPLASASETSLRVMASLVEAVGARPLFIDAAEHDALIAGVVDVPEVVAAVLMRRVDQSPSAPDLYRLAGQAFLDYTAVEDDVLADRGALMTENAAAVLTWLDQVIDDLVGVRRATAAGDLAALESLFAAARVARAHLERPPEGDAVARTAHEELKSYNPIQHMFFGSLRKPKRSGSDDRSSS